MLKLIAHNNGKFGVRGFDSFHPYEEGCYFQVISSHLHDAHLHFNGLFPRLVNLHDWMSRFWLLVFQFSFTPVLNGFSLLSSIFKKINI
jgi:hypothetical protein